MRYGSVCSGIEAATAAWHPLGWRPAFFSEIEKFPSAVLAHHYPDVTNLGDMTKFKEWPDADINVLVGGTPCQSFSVAGFRKGLDDPRGNLMLTYLAIAGRYLPRWVVWENVPGVLSSNGGRDFGAFLGALGELGYGFAYRVLDAQYFGVAQRRRRVFVVGCLGDWRAAAAVLFERQSLRGDPAPSREAGKESAGTLASRTTAGGFPGTDEAREGYVQPVAGALCNNGKAAGSATQQDAESGLLVAAYGGNNTQGQSMLRRRLMLAPAPAVGWILNLKHSSPAHCHSIPHKSHRHITTPTQSQARHVIRCRKTHMRQQLFKTPPTLSPATGTTATARRRATMRE